MTQTALLTPVFTLILWTFAITAIMAYGRVRFTKDPQDAAHTRDLKGMMPAWVERTADNYNHLFEQPVAFYVVTLSIALMNNIEPLTVQLAWGVCVCKNYPLACSTYHKYCFTKICYLCYWLANHCLYGTFSAYLEF